MYMKKGAVTYWGRLGREEEEEEEVLLTAYNK